MNEIIEYIDGSLSNSLSLISNLNFENEDLLKRITELEKYMLDVDSIDKDLLLAYVDEDISSSILFNNSMSLIGFYKEYEEQSQTKECKNYLNELISNILLRVRKNVSSKNELIENENNKVEGYKEIKNIIIKYGEENKISKSDFIKIFDFVCDMPDIDNEVVSFFIEIGKNNLNKAIEHEEVNESLEMPTEPKKKIDISEIEKERIDISSENNNDFTEKKIELLKIMNEFNSNTQLRENNPELYEKILHISHGYDKKLSVIPNDELEVLLFSLENDIPNYDNIPIKLMTGFLNEDLESVNSVLEEYVNNNNTSMEDYLYLTDNNKTLEVVTKAKKYLIDNFFDSTLFNQVSSLNSISNNEEKAAYMKINNLTNKDEYIYSLNNSYEELLILFEMRPFNEEEKNELQKSIDSLENAIKNIEEIEALENDNKNDVNTIPPEETENEELYSGFFNNYFVLLDPEMIKNSIDDIMLKKHEDPYSDLANKLKKITLSPIDDLKNGEDVKVIKRDHKNNPYKIKELSGGMTRLGIKRIGNAEIDGHPVYLVIDVGYGKMGGKAKQDEIEKNVPEFESRKSKYEQIVKICSKENNINGTTDEAKRLIDIGTEFYKYLLSSHKNKLDRKPSVEGGIKNE